MTKDRKTADGQSEPSNPKGNNQPQVLLTKGDLEEAKRFAELTSAGGHIGQFVRGHLIIERALTSALERAANNPDALKVDRIRFSDKARLATAFGLLRPAYLATILAINTVRNNLVHRLEADFVDDDFRRLLNSLPAEMQTKVREHWDRQGISHDQTAMHPLMAFVVGLLVENLRYRRPGPLNANPSE